MTYSFNDIITDVRKAIDEIGVNDSNFALLKDNEEMEAIIKSKVAESADYAHGNCLLDLLRVDECGMAEYDSTAEADVNATVTADCGTDNVVRYHGIDLLRVVSASSEHWPYPVCGVIYESDPEYVQITNGYVGAEWDRPAVTASLVQGDDGMEKVIELRRVKESSDWCRLVYIERCVPGTANVDVNSGVYRGFLLRLAGYVCLTYMETDRAKVLWAMSNEELGIEVNN